MKKIFVFLFCSISFLNSSNSQTATNAYIIGNLTNDTIVICHGDSVELVASIPKFDIINSNFNNSGLDTAVWSGNSTVLWSNPCSPTVLPADGIVCWFGGISYPRELMTKSFSTSTAVNCRVEWDMKYGANQNQTNCEAPDLPTEGVHLLFSVNNGSTWTQFSGYDQSPSGIFGDTNYINGSGGYWTPAYANAATGPYYSWNHYSSALPAAALSPATKIRWFQDLFSSNNYDHWGIDNVRISCELAPIYSWSNGATGSSSTFMPTVNTWHYITITDTSSIPHISTTDSVYIVVKPLPTSDFTVISPICSYDSSILQFTGNSSMNSIFYWNIEGDTLQTTGNGTAAVTVKWNNPVYAITNPIELIVEDQFHCKSNPVVHNVIVNQIPDVSFLTSQPTQGCPPLTISFSDETIPMTVSRIWNFGDGDTSSAQNPTHIYLTSGSFPLTLSVVSINGCQASFVQQNLAKVFEMPQPPIITIQGDTLFANILQNTYFQWYMNGSLIPGANNYFYVPQQAGNYSVTVKNSDDCFSLQSASILLSVESIDIVRNNILLPNPTNSYFSFRFNQIVNQVDIINTNGVLVKTFPSNNATNMYDVDNLARGLYFVKVYVDGNVSMQKLIKL